MAKLSDAMALTLEAAAKFGYQGETLGSNRKTEDALLRRGLITYDYDARRFACFVANGYRNAILTVAGWAATGLERPKDRGRYTLARAVTEAHDPTVSDAFRKSDNRMSAF